MSPTPTLLYLFWMHPLPSILSQVVVLHKALTGVQAPAGGLRTLSQNKFLHYKNYPVPGILW